MRQRITYIRNNEDDFNPKQLAVDKTSMTVTNLAAAKEHRFTIGFSELPRELTALLEQCHELRIRWASEKSYMARPPFVSRVAPGLHVFYTPEKEGKSDLLCPTLKKVFSEDIKCSNPAETFSHPSLLSPRFASSASSHYHTLLPSLANLHRYLQPFLENTLFSDSKTPAATSILSAGYFDVDYDAISHALLVTVYWDEGPDSGAWNERIVNTGGDRVEVGLLNEEEADEKEEIGLGGWLVVVGENEKASPTLFSFPSRHHSLSPSSSLFQTTFLHPTGLHPTLLLTLPQAPIPPAPTCALHAYLTLPSALFLDRHAFSDPLFLRSHHLSALHSIHGATDLEAPDWAVKTWGSAALFELNTSSSTGSGKERGGYTATIPLHTRYLTPSASGAYINVSMPYPSLFWACKVPEGAPGSAKMSVNPFDRVNLGYDGLFGDRTLFYHFTPQSVSSRGKGVSSVTGSGEESASLTATLAIPTLDLRQTQYVELGTVLAVILGTCWILWCLLKPLNTQNVAKVQQGTKRHPETQVVEPEVLEGRRREKESVVGQQEGGRKRRKV